MQSSFKQTISLGLKNVTQVVGSVVSMLAISPLMTGYLLLGVPLVITCGTFIGVAARMMIEWSTDSMWQYRLAVAQAVAPLSGSK